MLNVSVANSKIFNMENLKHKQVPRVRVQVLSQKENLTIEPLNLAQLLMVLEKRDVIMTPNFKPKFIRKNASNSSRGRASPALKQVDEKTQKLIDVRKAYFRSLSNSNR